jgi:hypothetical protein
VATAPLPTFFALSTAAKVGIVSGGLLMLGVIILILVLKFPPGGAVKVDSEVGGETDKIGSKGVSESNSCPLGGRG